MKREVFRIAVWASAIMPLYVTDARGDEVVGVQAAEDAFVTSAQPAGNYGGAGALSVAAPGSSKGEFQSVLRFDMAAAKTELDAALGPGQWTITGVALRLTAAFPNNPIFKASSAGQFSVEWMANDAWVEGNGSPGNPGATGVTFASLPTFLGSADEALGTYGFDGATSGSSTYALTLGPGLVADILAGDLASLRIFAAADQVSYLFNSRNFGNPLNRPELSITAVPEPAGLLLLLTAGAIIARRRSRV